MLFLALSVLFFCLCWLNMWKLDEIQFNGKIQSSKLMKISELKWNATHLCTERISENFAFGNTWENEWIFFCRKVNTYLFLDMMSAFQLCNSFFTRYLEYWQLIKHHFVWLWSFAKIKRKSAKSVNNKFASVYFFPASQKCFDLIMCDF